MPLTNADPISRLFNTTDFGYRTITVERTERNDEDIIVKATEVNDSATYFITWTTYGTWLPGDPRGWRKTRAGNQPAQPLLADWCLQRLTDEPVVLNTDLRKRVEVVCNEHAAICGWKLHAINVRSNHVHVAVTADKDPHAIRDQFKANATRVLRQMPNAIANEKVWTRGGDCTVIGSDEGLRRVIEYIMEEQDQK